MGITGAMTKLDQYLSDQRIRQADFARLLEVRQATVSRLAAGQQLPSLRLAIRIERVTGGAVPANSWDADCDPENTGAAA